MTQDAEFDTAAEAPERRRRSFWWRWIALPLLVIGAAVVLAVWFQRHTIAGNVIDNYLRSHHVRATYTIEHIGGTREVLSHLVVGDPAHPDLTVERVEVAIRYRFGFPTVGGAVLVRPRLYGTYLNGKISFGAADPLIFQPQKPKQPFELPDLTLKLVDGRALLETDHGPVGIKAEGEGYLRGGFKGVLAATAPKLAFGSCALAGTTLYGKLGIDAERPTFSGPLRMQSLDCGAGSAQLRQAALTADIKIDRDFAGGDATIAGGSGAAGFAEAAAQALRLKGKASFRAGELTASYDVNVTGLSHPQGQLGALAASGTLRAGDRMNWVRLESDFKGSGLRPGHDLDTALANAADGARDTLLGAVLRKIRGALQREAAGSSLTGQASWSKTGAASSLVIPQASVIGGSGEALLSLSRFQYGSGDGGVPRLSGNLATGGRDLPRIEATIEQQGAGGFAARLAMATYSAPGGSVAIPSLAIASKDGRLGFAGRAILSGDLPGGYAEGLLLPISGNWSRAGGLVVWRECTQASFDSLRFANLTLQRRGLTVCPAKGQPIVRYGAAGLRIAAGIPSLDVTGRLGQTPVAIRSGPIGFAYPGTVTARRLLVTLGPRATATTFAINDLTGHIGKTISGRFGGTDVKLFSVPMDIVDASGAWSYAGGRLHLDDGAFRLLDRQKPPRFEPLAANGASLSLQDNVITANAALRVPNGGPEVTEVALRHDLATGRGHADLIVSGLTFGKALQPEQLSRLAFGVVANVAGTVTGTGRIDWDEKGVTSSGKFSSNSLDFAAAFGPVKGASGTIVFTDLLGLTTAPNQVIKVASVNPGIEVTDGEIAFQLSKGQVLTVNRGTWPFMGGTLTMRPVTLNLGTSEQRAYILDIKGLDAAVFVQHMDLENISATGIFDGQVPLIFDADGNGRIEGGHLQSRGGGNVSYVGDLTYKDLSAMANMAFDALRSLDYRGMTVDMNGPLTGEIVTRVRFDGVSQGKGATKNFITRRIGKLPFRFVITITAQFYQLITNIRSMYDPTMVRSPEDLAKEGLLIDQNGNVVPVGSLPKSPPAPSRRTPDEGTIQRPESENKP
jgi:hypothetical protein